MQLDSIALYKPWHFYGIGQTKLVIQAKLVMGYHGFLLFALLALAYAGCSSGTVPRTLGLHRLDRTADPLSPSYRIDTLNRSSFPPGFLFGAATASYQVEGAWNVSGKRPSVWDTMTHRFPEKIADGSNGDVACDSYHLYKEDVAILKEMNLDVYRFSIAWSRILPRGKLSGGVNHAGIQYYNDLINELLANGKVPAVTIFHFDTPQALEDEYGGFLSPKIVNDFRDYAELCFKSFGDRVKLWITVNEPYSYSVLGYDSGIWAPGRCSAWTNGNCNGGNSGTEPYIATHHQLLGHAAAVQLYRQKYQPIQKGKIGATIVSIWFVPFANTTQDKLAAKRALDFMFGWFMDPLVFGRYPLSMRNLLKERLPEFTKEQSQLVKGSLDFLGFNYYTANYAAHNPIPNKTHPRYSTDFRATLTTERLGVPIGGPSGSDWLHSYPRGIWNLLNYIKTKYKNPPIYITENGIDEVNNESLPLQQSLIDNFRINYHYQHLAYVHRAIKDGVNVVAYIAWAIIDNFEFSSGYTVRFGLNFVDYKNGLKRYPKLSAQWFKRFLHK